MLPVTGGLGDFVTATATSPDGSTSEFSQAILIQDGIFDFPKKGISNGVQQGVPGGNGSFHFLADHTRVNGQPRAASLVALVSTGDGNGDSIQDYLQPNVVSFPSIAGKWITLVSPANTALESVSPSGPPDFANLPAGYTFPLGFVNFTITGLAPGSSVIVTNLFHDAIDYDTVFAYGSTPDNRAPHWYEFLFNSSTGARLDVKGFTLTFSDGNRGDHDLTANGTVTTVLAPAYKSPPGPQVTLLNANARIRRIPRFTATADGGFELVTNEIAFVTSVLAWPASVTNYFLEFTGALSPANVWQPAFDSPATLNNQNVITNTATNTARYYRLRRY